MPVDAATGRGDPCRELAGFGNRLGHQRKNKLPVFLGRKPVVGMVRPLGLGQDFSLGRNFGAGERADMAVGPAMRQLEFEIEPGLLDDPVPV